MVLVLFHIQCSFPKMIDKIECIALRLNISFTMEVQLFRKTRWNVNLTVDSGEAPGFARLCMLFGSKISITIIRSCLLV